MGRLSGHLHEQDRSASAKPWKRDLDLDLQVIRQWQTQALVTLTEEFELLSVPELTEKTRALGIRWFHVSIVDVWVPDKVFVRIFRNRIEVASPGYPLKPLTLAKLRRGAYRPCSRNPLIAQTLATLDKMEQRGSGFARMRDAMLDHGLDEPRLDQQDGFSLSLSSGRMATMTGSGRLTM
jgi:hypothetical protein